MYMEAIDKKNILKNDILFKITGHSDCRTSERSIPKNKFYECISNVAESDNWNIWLNLHTTEDGEFDLLCDDQPIYRVYDPVTKVTAILLFWKINRTDSLNNIRRISVLSAWNGRPVGPSKKNLKKNKFHKFRSFQKPRNQNYRVKVPYFHLIKGNVDIKEAS
tara:strand:- start:1676 stop:2164 length:489 start_codon:yes stop_codon:yes gene_type:complete